VHAQLTATFHNLKLDYYQIIRLLLLLD
jgi:hypothetical protein